MTLKDFYSAVGGNYDEVLSRLVSERLITKFVLKFKDDDSFALLESAVEANDYKTAFRASHTLKGVCSTLGFSTLFKSSSELTEYLRNNVSPEKAVVDNYFKTINNDYLQVLNNIENI